MKKLLVSSAFIASSLLAATPNQSVINFIKGKLPDNVTMKVLSFESLKNAPEFSLLSFSISDANHSQEQSMIVKGDYIFPDIYDAKNNLSLMQNIQKAQNAKKLSSVYKQENKANIISIGNDTKKETLVVFSDPECPYCRHELEQIEERLKTKNIKMILTPVHGKSSLEKSALIYKQITKAKSDKEKIDLLKKYFDKNADISKEKVEQKEVDAIENLRNKYLPIFRGVPYVIEENKLK